jgi:hypothetical protein
VDDYAVGTAAIGGGSLSWPVFKWSERCGFTTPAVLTCVRILVNGGFGSYPRV